MSLCKRVNEGVWTFHEFKISIVDNLGSFWDVYDIETSFKTKFISLYHRLK